MAESVLNNSDFHNLTNKKLLAKNAIWNFGAQGLPLIIAVFTIPFIIRGMGTDRFSILTLIWGIIGYSSLFDLGLGRALTQLVSKKIGLGETEDLITVIWTALIIISLMGVVAAIVVSLFTPLIVHLLKIPANFRYETTISMYLLALTLPLLISNMGIKGVLEAYQRFDMTSLLRIPVIIFNYIGPLAVIPFTHNLAYIVGVLVIGRIITYIAHIFACSIVIKEFFQGPKFKKQYVKSLLSFGGWITISNIIAPLMTYMDRFLIAGMLSATIVAYYATPYDVITKLSIIPTAIIGVMFPAFGAQFFTDKKRTKRLYFKSIKYIFLLLIIPVIGVILLAKFGLTIWLSAEFAEKSFRVVQLLAICVLLTGLNQTPFALVQATGRSDITAKIHMFELPIYLAALWIFIKSFGLIGAPMAYLVRIIIDSCLLHVIALKLMKE